MADHINASFKILHIQPNSVFQGLPVILQKLLVNTFPGSGPLPKFLSNKGDSMEGQYPNVLITSGRDAVAGALALKSKFRQSIFSVYLGFPDVPFINFDHVILPKHEAATKLAKLGPLSSQKNYTTTMAPSMSLGQQDDESMNRRLSACVSPAFHQSKSPMTAFVVGKHHHHCRWYPEDAALVADNIERIIKNLDHRVLLVYTDKTVPKVKETIDSSLNKRMVVSSQLAVCDLSKIENVKEKCDTYDAILQASDQAVLTADLDYLVMEAVVKRKPVYIAFQDRCSSHLLQIHRWLRESHLTRKLRLDRMRNTMPADGTDVYSYLGNHKPWADGKKALNIDADWRKADEVFEE